MIARLATAMIVLAATLAGAAETLKKPAPAKAPADPAAPKWKLLTPEVVAGLTEKTGIVCAVYGKREVTLDLYIPDGAGPFPGILMIHGGGWHKGQVSSDKPLAARIAKAGYVVAQVSYRLSGEAPYPAALHDCKAAVRWMRANAKAAKIDADRIGSIGGSAGGQLSGLLAMTNGDPAFEGDGGHGNYSSAVQACIVMACTMDLFAAYAEKPSDPVKAFLGTDPATYKLASPINHVKATSPPTIFIEGEKDTYKTGRPEMQQKLRDFGIPTWVYTLKHAPHPFWMSNPWCDQSAEIAIRFFDEHLKQSASPVSR